MLEYMFHLILMQENTDERKTVFFNILRCYVFETTYMNINIRTFANIFIFVNFSVELFKNHFPISLDK